MTPKFKPGPAKTRDGRDAVIYEIAEDRMYVRIDKSPHALCLDGRWYLTQEFPGDLLPNVEPFRFEARVEWARWDGAVIFPLCKGGAHSWSDLIGKRGVLVFTEEE